MDATQALIAHTAGDSQGKALLLQQVYGELRALAAAFMRRERPDHTLQPTALVHEAYIRLIDRSRIDERGKSYFFAAAAAEMRRVLVDHARRVGAEKRGGGMRKVTLVEGTALTTDFTLDVLALDEALKRLSSLSARQGRVVELRFFGGLTVRETARLLEVSERTVRQDWLVARAWLLQELRS